MHAHDVQDADVDVHAHDVHVHAHDVHVHAHDVQVACNTTFAFKPKYRLLLFRGAPATISDVQELMRGM